MKSSKSIFGILGLMFALVIAAGCASTPDTASASAATEEDPDRMVCRREEKLGSRLASRTCKTAAEWEQERLDNKDAKRSLQDRPAGLSNLPSAGGG